jgi:hypothetical protein
MMAETTRKRQQKHRIYTVGDVVPSFRVAAKSLRALVHSPRPVVRQSMRSLDKCFFAIRYVSH